MMDPETALLTTLQAHLSNASPIWGARVYPVERVPAKVARTYVAYFVASGGSVGSVATRRAASFTVSVKAVADEMAAALDARAVISGLLDDSGEQDVNPVLPATAGWHILTVTETQQIRIDEQYEQAVTIYHRGFQYEIRMEERNDA